MAAPLANRMSIIEKALNNPYVRATLDMIAEAEVGRDATRTSDQGYFATFSGKRYNGDLSTHPNVYGSFIGRDGKRHSSNAAGRYQFLKSTYDDLSRRYGFKDFTPRTQDMMAIALMMDVGALDDIMAGQIERALPKLGKRWAALPQSRLGRNMHGGRSQDFINESYTRNLRRHANGAVVRYPNTAAGVAAQTDNDLYPFPVSGFTTVGGVQIPVPNIDMSRIPQLNWQRYTAQALGQRYGNRVLLSLRPGQLNEASGTILTAAAVNPRSGMPYTTAPHGHIDETTLVLQQPTDRSADGVRVQTETTPAATPTAGPNPLFDPNSNVPPKPVYKEGQYGSAVGGVDFPLQEPRNYPPEGIRGRDLPPPDPDGVLFPLEPPREYPPEGIRGRYLPPPDPDGVLFPLEPPREYPPEGIRGRDIAAVNLSPDDYLAENIPIAQQRLDAATSDVDDFLRVAALERPFTNTLLDLIERTPTPQNMLV